MTQIRQEAVKLLEQIPENKVIFIIQIMQGLKGLYADEGMGQSEDAFLQLEKMRKKCRIWIMKRNWRNIGRRDMGVRILVDTNIILDYLLEREPYGEQARTII